MLANDIDTGKAVLRDSINVTIGFEHLSRVFGQSSKSLMRMLLPHKPTTKPLISSRKNGSFTIEWE
jgi:hypothetical protein